MIKVYPAIFHEEENSFWVEFPDLEGCHTYADTLTEAMESASEALGLYLASRIDNKQEINSPSDIKQINVTDGFASYIAANVEKYLTNNKAVKKTLSIPQWLNEAAESQNINFSSVLKEALIEKIS